MKDWDSAYRKKGEIQTWVSPLVKDSIGLLEKRKAKKILDLCFGTGRNTIFLAEKGFDVYGIDISKKGKEITENKAKAKNLENVHLKLGDMKEIPFDDNFFDAIVAVNCLEHNTLRDLKKTISEIERVLKPKGILIAGLISKKDPRYGTGRELEPNTFIDLEDPTDSDLPHRFSDEKEVRELFTKFNLIKLMEKSHFSKRRNKMAAHWEIIAEKT